MISSHNLNDIESICDHYVILDDQHLQTSAIMDDNKEKYHYCQLAFKEAQAREAFKGLKIADLTLRGKVVTLIVEGNQEDIEQSLKSMNPILLEKLAISLEEIFVAKVKGGDFYG